MIRCHPATKRDSLVHHIILFSTFKQARYPKLQPTLPNKAYYIPSKYRIKVLLHASLPLRKEIQTNYFFNDAPSTQSQFANHTKKYFLLIAAPLSLYAVTVTIRPDLVLNNFFQLFGFSALFLHKGIREEPHPAKAKPINLVIIGGHTSTIVASFSTANFRSIFFYYPHRSFSLLLQSSYHHISIRVISRGRCLFLLH